MVLATGKVQAMLMLVGILSLAMMLRGMLDVTEGPPRVTCSAVRFSVLSLRNGSMPEDVASPSGFPGSFGVLLNGCKVAAIASEQLMEDCDDAGRHVSERNRRTTQHRRLRQYLTPAAGTQLEFNGISFKTAAQSAAAADPETFVVECAEENGMDFKLVAASGICGWFPTSGHHISLSAAQGKLPPAQIPLKRDKVVKWDYTATRCLQPTYLRLIGAMTSAMAFVLTSSLTLYTKRARALVVEIPTVFQTLFACLSISQAFRISALFYDWRLDYFTLWNSLGFLFLLISGVFKESHLTRRLMAFGVYEATAFLALNSATDHFPLTFEASLWGLVNRHVDSRTITMAASVASLVLVMGVQACYFYWSRAQQREVEKDKARVEKAWLHLLSSPQTRSALRQVLSLTDEISSSRQRTSSSMHSLKMSSNLGIFHTDPKAGLDCSDAQDVVPTKCMDQLYFQAAVISPSLIAKVQQWVSLSARSTPVIPSSASSASAHDAPLSSRVDNRAPQMAFYLPPLGLLDPTLATRDAILKYRGDPSRVVNLVHQVVVCDDVASQERCLKSLRDDGEVDIVGLINRQIVHHELREYEKPCITVYVKFNTPFAHDMAVSGHICELELILRPMWNVFEDQGLQLRYNAYRECLYLLQGSLSHVEMPCRRHKETDLDGMINSAANSAQSYEQEQRCDSAYRESAMEEGSSTVHAHDVESGQNGPAGGHDTDGRCRAVSQDAVKEFFCCSLSNPMVDGDGMSFQIRATPYCPDNEEGSGGNIAQVTRDWTGRPLAHARPALPTGPLGRRRGKRQGRATHQESGNDICWTAAQGRGEQQQTEEAQCKFSKLLSQRLVEGHVIINNIYFAAAVDHRLRELLQELHCTSLEHIEATLKPGSLLSDGVGGDESGGCIPAYHTGGPGHASFSSKYSTMIRHGGCAGGLCSMLTPEMRTILRQKTSRPGSYLHRRGLDGQEGARTTTWVSIIFSASPITLAFTKWEFNMVLSAMAFVYIIALTLLHFPAFMSANTVTARHFCFNATELRAGNEMPASELVIGSFALIKNGCVLPAQKTHGSRHGSSLFLTSRDSKPISANGFSFRTASAPHDPAFDPVGFEFLFCSDTSAETPADCPTNKWNVIGSAECLFTAHSLHCFPVRDRRFPTSSDHDVEHSFDLRAPWNHSLHVIGRMVFSCVGFLTAVIFGLMGHARTARFLGALLSFFLNGLINGCMYAFTNFVKHYGTNQAWTSIYPMIVGIAVGMGCGGLGIFAENLLFIRARGLWPWYPIALGMALLSIPLDGLLVFNGGRDWRWWTFALEHGAWAEISTMLGFYVLVEVLRRYVWHQALLSVQDDMNAYEQEWQHVLAEDSYASLDKLAQLSCSIEKASLRMSRAQATVLQRLRSSSVPAQDTIFGQSFSPEEIGACVGQAGEVTDLDQLYLQAGLVWPISAKIVSGWASSPGSQLIADRKSTLQAAVMDISLDSSAIDYGIPLVDLKAAPAASSTPAPAAAASDDSDDYAFNRHPRSDSQPHLIGVNPGSGWNELCSWTKVKVSGGYRAGVKWAAVKTPTRAIEKLQRVYNKKVSHLIDLVRQSIVFQTIEELATCLDVILNDPQVRVLRIKNRYSIDFNAASTGGYRDVLVNFIIVTEEACMLGVHGHVCELQLVHARFHRLKTLEGHRRYVEYRNRRAE